MKNLYQSFKSSKWFPLVIGVLSIVLGLICLFYPEIRMETVALLLGGIVLLYGLIRILIGIVSKDGMSHRIAQIAVGVIAVVLAILIFANLPLIGKYLPVVVGFYMIVCALFDCVRCLMLWKSGVKNWWIGAIPAVIVLVLGLVILLHPGLAGKALGIFTGVSLLVNGLSEIVSFFQIKK